MRESRDYKIIFKKLERINRKKRKEKCQTCGRGIKKRFTYEYNGKVYSFCTKDCKITFIDIPF